MSHKDSEKNLANAEDSEEDEDDEDYVPENETDDETPEELGSSKRKLGDESDEESLAKCKKDEIEPIKEEDKKKADQLWASFLQDVKSKPVKTADYGRKYQETVETRKKEEVLTPKPKTDFFSAYETNKDTDEQKNETSQVTESEKDSKRKKPMGMAAILDKINNNEKISTLEKSKMDWNEFKKAKKIEDDLATQVKGKNSYLDKQAFLDRADQRQFELEKELRDKERKRRDARF